MARWAAFKAAAAPTIARLEKDPAPKALIAKIRSLSAATRPEPR
ncbi:hypothetical protein [Arthrobacter sp. FW305-BF8]|nr:hypothetical protein [Arthrobacter sp. FW305-BF8]